jgi:general secretion pathway protein C
MDSTILITQLKEYWAKVPQKQLSFGLLLLLTISIAYSLAQLTWIATPTPKMPSGISLPGKPIANSSANTSNISKLSGLNLFGKVEEKKVDDTATNSAKVFDAPETKLNLVLTSAVASTDDSRSAAIIENNKVQEIYAIGEKINGTNATVNNILIDRVIIDVNARKETLMLDGFEYTQISEAQVAQGSHEIKERPSKARPNDYQPIPAENQPTEEFTEQIDDLKDALANDPGKIIDYISISPVNEDGQIKGYRLTPAKDPSFFNAAGLQSGDIAVEINGKNLTDPSQALEALQLLREESQISLLVERAGQLTEIFFSTQ